MTYIHINYTSYIICRSKRSGNYTVKCKITIIIHVSIFKSQAFTVHVLQNYQFLNHVVFCTTRLCVHRFLYIRYYTVAILGKDRIPVPSRYHQYKGRRVEGTCSIASHECTTQIQNIKVSKTMILRISGTRSFGCSTSPRPCAISPSLCSRIACNTFNAFISSGNDALDKN